MKMNKIQIIAWEHVEKKKGGMRQPCWEFTGQILCLKNYEVVHCIDEQIMMTFKNVVLCMSSNYHSLWYSSDSVTTETFPVWCILIKTEVFDWPYVKKKPVTFYMYLCSLGWQSSLIIVLHMHLFATSWCDIYLTL